MLKHFLFSLLLLPFLGFSQHSISGTFSPPEEFSFVILYKVLPSTLEYVGNTQIDKTGHFDIYVDSTATNGVYRLVYAIPQEDYHFDVILNNREDVELNFSFDEGVTFLKSHENKLLSSYRKSMGMVNDALVKFYETPEQNKEDFEKLTTLLHQTQTEYEKAAEGTLALNFIKAGKSYIPKSYEDANTFYKNSKNNYYSNIDFDNPALQNSGFLMESAVNYIFGYVNGSSPNKEYIENIDKSVAAMGSQEETKQIILETLWSQFSGQDNAEVANYIADAYLIPIAKEENDTELLETLTSYKNTSLNSKAPNFRLNESGDDLYSLNTSNNYVIVFWSSSCSHCLEEIPQLNKFTDGFDKSKLQVIAVGLEEEPDQWKKTITKYPNFIHIYGDGKWDNPIGDTYGVTATPTYFVLDKNKVIVDKPETIDDVKEYFDKLN